MKRAATLIAALTVLVLLAGCPFESDVPLGAPGAGSLDAQLRGKWVVLDGKEPVAELDFLPFNACEYYAEYREAGQPTERYRVYTVRINRAPILNISPVKDEAGSQPFYFARYTVSSNGELSLRFIGDKAIPKALSTDQKMLASFVEAHLQGTFLDDGEPVVLHRPHAETPVR